MIEDDEDTHERMIKAFQEYFKYHDRFESDNNIRAGIDARYWLSEIRSQASKRRVEIKSKQTELKISRKGKPGRPKRVTKGA
jgi:galactose mutarotase-like enzyme